MFASLKGKLNNNNMAASDIAVTILGQGESSKSKTPLLYFHFLDIVIIWHEKS